MTIDIRNDEMLTLRITGADLQVLVTGLGELPHKLAAPVEAKLVQQVTEQKKPAYVVGE